MIDEAEIPKEFYRLEYQSDIDVGTDHWEKGNAYESEVGAQSALLSHINSYPFLPVRVTRVVLFEDTETLGRYLP